MAEMEERQVPEKGETERPRPTKEQTVTFPKCTTEGVGYTLECWECRLGGMKYMYVGETSRSPYQRGKEHEKDIGNGKKTHPLWIHFGEKHGGERQRILMRVIATPQTAMARQVWESVQIDKLSRDKNACLNLKSEWGMSRTPGLQNREWKPPLRKGEGGDRTNRRGREDVKEEREGKVNPHKRVRRDGQEGEEDWSAGGV